MARVLGQNACTQRPAVWLLRSLQVVLISGCVCVGGGKLSTPYQMADLGWLRQGGKVRSSSKKWIIEGATAERQPHWGVKPHPLETTEAGTASLHRDSLKATAPRGQRW